jgi:hypothetical protein
MDYSFLQEKTYFRVFDRFQHFLCRMPWGQGMDLIDQGYATWSDKQWDILVLQPSNAAVITA